MTTREKMSKVIRVLNEYGSELKALDPLKYDKYTKRLKEYMDLVGAMEQRLAYEEATRSSESEVERKPSRKPRKSRKQPEPLSESSVTEASASEAEVVVKPPPPKPRRAYTRKHAKEGNRPPPSESESTTEEVVLSEEERDTPAAPQPRGRPKKGPEVGPHPAEQFEQAKAIIQPQQPKWPVKPPTLPKELPKEDLISMTKGGLPVRKADMGNLAGKRPPVGSPTWPPKQIEVSASGDTPSTQPQPSEGTTSPQITHIHGSYLCEVCNGYFTYRTRATHMRTKKHLTGEAKRLGYYDYTKKRIVTPQELYGVTQPPAQPSPPQ